MGRQTRSPSRQKSSTPPCFGWLGRMHSPSNPPLPKPAPTMAVVLPNNPLAYPLALLRIPSTHGEYLKEIGPKTRNMIRKAEQKGYEFKEFNWNDHLDEIYEINISKDARQSESMRGWYREPV